MRFGTIPSRQFTFFTIAVCALIGLVSPPAVAFQDDGVIVTVPTFGVGGRSRAGDWAAIRVNLSDQGSQVREVVVWIENKDPDGDYPRYYRVLATAPGEVKSLWLFTKLPPGIRNSSGVLPVVVHEASTDTNGKLQVGKRLGETEAAVRGVLNDAFSITGIVGRSHAGLIGYTATPSGQNSIKMFAIGGNERMILDGGIDIEGLPDRWYGLMQFDNLVWTEGSATPLSVDQAAAIREWVMRGGHFIVVMRDGDLDWLTDARFNPLYPIMPAVNIDRMEGVDYEKYRGILAKPQSMAPLPRNQTVHVFTPIEGRQRETDAIRIITGSDGECVVTTRLLGTGAVTLVGLNLTSTSLLPAGRPHIEAFWNRVLGRRDKVVTKDDLNRNQVVDNREVAKYDHQISNRIDAKGAATQGVMLGFVVFLAYWLIAAPVSFALLKKADLLRHAWIAFVGATIIFTGVSWGGVALIKPKSGHNRHVTFLDHVYGPSVQRTRTFLSVLVSEYGEANISVGDVVDDGGEHFNNIITPFGDNSVSGSFPDSRGYLIDAAAPYQTTFPVRSTIKEFRVDWAGSTSWSMIRPVGGGIGTRTEPGEIRLIPQVPPAAGVHILEGVLEHNLPEALKDVVIIVNRGQRFYENNQDILARARLPYVFKPGGVWEAGVPLDLELLTINESPGADNRIKKWLDNHKEVRWKEPTAPTKALVAAGLINVMDPPEPRDNRAMTPLRSNMHGWDLGRWFTQPCVIVIGTIGDNQRGAECPTPIQVNGRPMKSSGLTIVRWIYPLPENPLVAEPVIDPNAPPPTSPIDGNG